MGDVGEKLIMDMLMGDVGDVGEKLIMEKETADLGDAEENLLWKPQNVQVLCLSYISTYCRNQFLMIPIFKCILEFKHSKWEMNNISKSNETLSCKIQMFWIITLNF